MKITKGLTDVEQEQVDTLLEHQQAVRAHEAAKSSEQYHAQALAEATARTKTTQGERYATKDTLISVLEAG